MGTVLAALLASYAYRQIRICNFGYGSTSSMVHSGSIRFTQRRIIRKSTSLTCTQSLDTVLSSVHLALNQVYLGIIKDH